MEEFDMYPPKPELAENKPKSSISLTVFSLVLFVLVYVLFFGTEEFNFIVFLLSVLIIHELGHFLAMKFFKYEDVRMLFIPLMGAFVQGKKRNYSERESLWVIISGPFPGVLIGSLLVWYSSMYHIPWMIQLGTLFLLLNIINLIPLDPLDGGQLLKIFVRKWHELLLMIIAFIASMAVIAVGVFIVYFNESNLGYAAILFGLFMGFRVRSLQKQLQMHRELNESGVNYKTSYKELSNQDYSKIKDVVISNTPQLQKYIDQIAPEQIDPLLASQVNNVLISPIDRDASLLFKIIIALFWVASFVIPALLYLTIDLNWVYPVFDFI